VVDLSVAVNGFYGGEEFISSDYLKIKGVQAHICKVNIYTAQL
jgi:hypothetical protein